MTGTVVTARQRELAVAMTYLRSRAKDELSTTLDHVATVVAEVERLRVALAEVAMWRKDAHAHDTDMGYPLRSFDEDTVAEIEAFATNALRP